MKYDLNHIYCADCYEAIKEIHNKSVDCIYTDIPYLYEQAYSGGREPNRGSLSEWNYFKYYLACKTVFYVASHAQDVLKELQNKIKTKK